MDRFYEPEKPSESPRALDFPAEPATTFSFTFKEQAKTGGASLAARERIRSSPDFKRWLRYAESQGAFLLGTLPPAPETGNQMVAFFLHPDQKHYFPYGGGTVDDFYDGRVLDYREEPPELGLPELPSDETKPPVPDAK